MAFQRKFTVTMEHTLLSVISLMAQKLQIELKNHCAYHPQSAGLVERHNGIIKSKLKKIMEETGKNWLYCLPLVVLNMHVTPASSGLTPFEMMYGRLYRIPQLIPFKRPEEEREQTLADYMLQMLTKRERSLLLISFQKQNPLQRIQWCNLAPGCL